MTDDYRKHIVQVLRRMRRHPSLSPVQRGCLESLQGVTWADELAVLSNLWPLCPELVEQYLDVMVSALHEFPESVVTDPTPLVAPLISTRA